MNERTKDQIERLSQGMVSIDAFDNSGRKLHQFESVIADGMHGVIMWSVFKGDYTAMSGDGGMLDREGMAEAEYVLFTREEQWDELEDVISRLHETEAEAVTRLITSHYNMEAMMNEAVIALKKIAEESMDEKTRDFAIRKVEFLKGLIPEDDEQI